MVSFSQVLALLFWLWLLFLRRLLDFFMYPIDI